MPSMYYYGFGMDPTYLLVLIGVVISMIASARVKSTFNKYDKYCFSIFTDKLPLDNKFIYKIQNNANYNKKNLLYFKYYW